MVLIRRIIASTALAGLAAFPFAAAHADPYDRLAKDIMLTAKRHGYRRVAVLPLRAVGKSASDDGLVLAERIVSRLAGHEGLEVVERTLLDSVLREQRLGHEGFIDPNQAQQLGRVLGVEAVMTGTYLPLTDSRIEVHTRLIDAETARILGVSVAKVKKEWEDHSFVVTPPWDAFGEGSDPFRVPAVRIIPDPFRDAVAGGGPCSDWEKRVDMLQSEVIEAKAQLWARRLREPGFSAASLTRNPGSEIRSMELRQIFYGRLKELYNRYYNDGVSAGQKARIEYVDRKADELRHKCY